MRRIAVQIGLSYLALTALTVGIGAVAAELLTDLSDALERTLVENVQSVVAAERLSGALAAQARARAAADSAAGAAAAREFRAALGLARRAAFLPEEPALIDSIGAAHARALAAATDAEADRFAEQADRLGARLRVLNEQAAAERAARAQAASRTARSLLLLAVGLAVVASLVAGLVFAGRISRPLRELTARAARVGRGHFDQRVDASAGGEVGALAEAFNDMSARLQAYEALHVRALARETRTAESLVAAIPNPVLVTEGPEGRVRMHNAAAEALLAPGPALGRPLAEAAPALADRGDEALVEVGEAGRARTFRLRRTLAEIPAPRADADGADADRTDAPAGDRVAVLLLDDVTPFRALDAARSSFLAAVSHELRTPLTSMHVALDLLSRDAAHPLPEAQRELVDVARADAARMRGLVARLLDLARVEVGARAAGPVDLAAVARRAAEGVRLVAAERGVAVDVEAAPDLPAALGDADGLDMAVSNLVANAVRHARTRVRVRLDAAEGGVRVRVDDDGAGLPAGTEGRVFEPLVQLGAADGADAPRGSAGLGLTIVRRVAEAHGGRATAAPGPGGHFALTLPALPPAP